MEEAEQNDSSAAAATAHMSRTFFERIEKGNNLTKMGSSSKPRDTAMLGPCSLGGK